MAVLIQICENLKKIFLAKINLLEPSTPLMISVIFQQLKSVIYVSCESQTDREPEGNGSRT